MRTRRSHDTSPPQPSQGRRSFQRIHCSARRHRLPQQGQNASTASAPRRPLPPRQRLPSPPIPWPSIRASPSCSTGAPPMPPTSPSTASARWPSTARRPSRPPAPPTSISSPRVTEAPPKPMSASPSASPTVPQPRRPQPRHRRRRRLPPAVKDLFFDYDSYDLRPAAETSVTAGSAFLNAHPDIKVLIGGYCDDRGSAEYNITLGENRANAAKQALVALASPERIRVVSYGKERQFCTEENEACWQQNRRAQFNVDR